MESVVQYYKEYFIRNYFWSIFSGSFPELDGFQVAYHFPIDGKTHQCFHGMKSVNPCRPGIDVKQVQLLVGHHFQDVWMAADKQPWRV